MLCFERERYLDVGQCLCMVCTRQHIFIGQDKALACFNHQTLVYQSPAAPDVRAMVVGDTKDSLICGDAQGSIFDVVSDTGSVRAFLRREQNGAPITALAFQRHDSRVIAGDRFGNIFEFQRPYDQLAGSFCPDQKLPAGELNHPITSLVFGPDCRYWAAGKSVGRYGVATDYTRKMKENVPSIGYSMNFPCIVIPEGDKIGMYPTLEVGCLRFWKLKVAVTAIDIHANGKILAVGNFVGGVELWDMETGKSLQNLGARFSTPVEHLRFDRGGTVLVSVHEPGHVTVWKLR